ncbi:hypothetical protein GCM10007392_44190 [Saccharospirillum salsuginis]|uniref:Uncharacterized protein n=1 Tax=Saccharospirillum salsuginis TaxID=418750 RepID=A0A918NJB6_9GAMM|nr:hypothetical protein GCM10007392_44190 [Saccharospirillum salsuginis]
MAIFFGSYCVRIGFVLWLLGWLVLVLWLLARAGCRVLPLRVARGAAHSTHPWELDHSIPAVDFPDREHPASVAHYQVHYPKPIHQFLN